MTLCRRREEPEKPYFYPFSLPEPVKISLPLGGESTIEALGALLTQKKTLSFTQPSLLVEMAQREGGEICQEILEAWNQSLHEQWEKIREEQKHPIREAIRLGMKELTQVPSKEQSILLVSMLCSVGSVLIQAMCAVPTSSMEVLVAEIGKVAEMCGPHVLACIAPMLLTLLHAAYVFLISFF